MPVSQPVWEQFFIQQGFEVVDTPLAWFLCNKADLWKIRKPLVMKDLDYSTPDKRRKVCEQEIEANQLLAPKVYRRVVPLRLNNQGQFHFGEEGEIVDWATHMVRQPEHHRADRRLENQSLTDQHLKDIADQLIMFHRRPLDWLVSESSSHLRRLHADLQELILSGTNPIQNYLTPNQVKTFKKTQDAFQERHQQDIQKRATKGRVRNVHGDFRLNHIYIDDQGEISIVDRLEGSHHQLWDDICVDVSSLSMDLKMHGRADLAEYFLTVYADHSDDFDIFPLVGFYESRHSYLRAQKKAYLASHQAIGTRQQKEADQAAQRLFKLAFSTDRRPLLPPIMVIMSGLVASGKSTVARAVARDISAPIVLSDHARDALLGLHRVDELSSSEWEHAFSRELHEEVYNEVFRRSRLALQSGRPVVVDGCFGSSQLRTHIRGLALECGVPFLFVECHCPEDVILERLRQRAEQAGIEEKTWIEISDGFRDKWESVQELTEMEHLVVDTSKPLKDTIALLRKRLPTWPSGLTQ